MPATNRPDADPEALRVEDYRSLVEHSPDLIARFDRQLGHAYVNPAARKSGILLAVPDHVRNVFGDGRASNHEIALPSPDGIRYFDCRFVPERKADGTIVTVLLVARDITAHKRLEESLQESREQLRRIMEMAPMSMAIVSMDGVIEYINNKAIETFGYRPEDIPTMEQWWVLAYPEASYRQEVVARWMGLVGAAIAEKHEITGGEYRTTCKDGSVKTVFIFGVPVVNKVFVMFDDITERKRAEEALKEGEAKYHRLYDSMMDAFVSVNMRGQVIDCNKTFQQMLGYTLEELRTLTYFELTPAKWHPIEARIVNEQILTCGYSDIYEKEYRRKDGTVFPIELRTFIIPDANHQPAAMCAIVRDISRRKQTDLLLRQTVENLKRSNKELEQFAYIASHDLQEPLRMVTALFRPVADPLSRQA